MWFSYVTYETPNSAKFMCLPFSPPSLPISLTHSLYLPPSLPISLSLSSSLPLYLFLCHSLSLPLSCHLSPSLPPSLPQVSKDKSASKTDPATPSTAAVTYKVRENQHYVASSMRRPKTWREELKPREPLLVGVITATSFFIHELVQ